MSSFNYTDNYTGFNDLINRADFLTEAKKSPYGKYHSSFGGVTKDLRSAGFSSAPLDTINFIRTTLYNLHLISDEELAAAKKGAGFAAKKKNLLALLDAKEDIIEKNKDKIAKAVESDLATYIKRSAVNRGKEDKYAAQKAENETKEAARKLAKDIKAGVDVGDAVDDTVEDIGQAEREALESIKMAKEDPTTMVEIKIADKDRIDDVTELVSQYANKDGVDISGNTLTFSADPDSPLADAVKRHGEDKVEAAIRRDVAKIADNAVAVMSPEEDYEVGVEPEGSPNEYEEDINDSEDEDNEFDDFDIGPQSDENVPDDYEEVLKAMVTKDKEQFAKNMIEDEEGDTLSKIERDISNGMTAKESMDSLGIHPSRQKDMLRKYLAYTDKYSEGPIETGFEDEEGGMRVLVAFAPGHSPEEMQANVDRYLAAAKKLGVKARAGKIDDEVAEVYVDAGPSSKEMKLLNDLQRDMLQANRKVAKTQDTTNGLQELEIGGHRYEVGEDDPHDDGIVIDIEKNKNGYTITGAVYSDPMDYIDDPDNPKEGYRYAIDQDGKYIGAPGGVGRINEAIKMQPHLEVSETSTAAYLTEQKQSDKRNKKAEVKNQSFKERYKPKTHWQLEELRRYGL